jgi:cystathionine beta-lyase/cystathionine gamma-synthase
VPKMLSRCRFVADVPSLGGTETTACIPLHTTHKWTEAEECKRLGVDEFVLRVSVGLESLDDIVADFRQAMLASAGP